MPPVYNISVREMEVILAVLTHGTMSMAAQELNISQPAISRLVKHAEDRSGLSLFDRRGTKLIPTSDLLELRPELQRVFVTIERAQTSALTLRQGLGRPIRMVSMGMLSGALLPQAIAGLRRIAPLSKVMIRMSDRVGCERDVLSEVCDLGLVHGVTDPAAVAATRLCEGRIVCLVPRSHRLSSHTAISPADLADEDLVSIGRHSPVSRRVTAAFAQAGLERRILVQTADSRLGAQLAVEGQTVALLDPFFIGSVPLDTMVLLPFTPRIAAPCFAIYRPDRRMPPLASKMLDQLKLAAATWQVGHDAVVPPG